MTLHMFADTNADFVQDDNDRAYAGEGTSVVAAIDVVNTSAEGTADITIRVPGSAVIDASALLATGRRARRMRTVAGVAGSCRSAPSSRSAGPGRSA